MRTIQLDLPDEVFSALRLDPARFVTELRFAAATHWYHQGTISGSKAATIAGVTRLEFLDELARRRMDVVVIDEADLNRELASG